MKTPEKIKEAHVVRYMDSVCIYIVAESGVAYFGIHKPDIEEIEWKILPTPIPI
jgi:hypothetical protein